MPRVTCDKCGLLVKEKYAVTIEYPDHTEIVCRTCTIGGRR